MKIRNASQSPLGIPGNTMLLPGETRAIRNWPQVSENRIVKAWIARGALVVVDGQPAEAGGEPAPDEKARLRAELKVLGIEPPKNAGIAKLRDLLAEAGGADASEKDAE